MSNSTTEHMEAADFKVPDGKIELLKVIAHPVRLMLLNELIKGVKCVSDIEELLDIRQSNVSQHLSLLRKLGVVDYFVDGKLRCYFLKDPMIPALLAILKKDDFDALPMPACCPVTRKGEYQGRIRH